jgi:group I intron endonuclease
MAGIYKIVSPKGKVYIGQSIDVNKRWKEYEKMQGVIRQPRLYRSIRKYGLATHQFILVEECEICELNNRERYWQDFFDATGKGGLNCRLTGTEDKSGTLSEGTRRKMSATRKGRAVSESNKKRISDTLTGRTLSEETRNKMSKSKKGIQFSEQHLANLRKPRKKLTCPHCKKEGGAAQMQQWHFDKCKYK